MTTIYCILFLLLGYALGKLEDSLTYHDRNERAKSNATLRGAVMAFDRYAEVVRKANHVGSGPIIMKDGTTLSNVAIFAKELDYGIRVDGNCVSVSDVRIKHIAQPEKGESNR